jgi:hypothetical protein
MSDFSAPSDVFAAGYIPSPGVHDSRKIKIGEVARRFDISVDLLRLYEREGLLIPIKSPKGTRYFTELDYPWIETLMRLVRSAGLNFAGIRHLLAALPCWQIRACGEVRHPGCNISDQSPEQPCWVSRRCCKPGDCYSCEVYRSASHCDHLKGFITQPRAS